MAFDRPDHYTLVFECEACPDQHEYVADRSPDFAVVWKAARELGWITIKLPGQPWQHFCPGCAEMAQQEFKCERDRDREREKRKQHNADRSD
jgi:hypothetical protein